MSKRGQMEEWIVHTIFYIILMVVLIIIVWGLYTGKLTPLWQKIVDKLRFF